MKATQAVRRAVVVLTEEVGKAIASEEPGDLAELLTAQRNIERLRADLKLVLDDLSEYAAGLMVARKQHVDGIGQIERESGINRSGWDHDRLFAIALARGRDAPDRYDVDSGEMLISEGEAVLREVRAMAAKPGYWKVGEMRDRGLTVDEFCVEEKSRQRVKLPKDDRRDEE